MVTSILQAIVLALCSISGLLVAVAALTRGRHKELTGRLLIAFSVGSALWIFSQGLFTLDWFLFPFIPTISRIPYLLLILVGVAFLHLTKAFIRKPTNILQWWVLGILWAAILFVAENFFFTENIPVGNGFVIPTQTLVGGVAAFGWGIAMLNATRLILVDYREHQQPLHRNRTAYWIFANLFIIAGGIFFLFGNFMVGDVLHFCGTLFAAYAIIMHRPIDIRLGFLRTVNYALTTLVAVTVYFLTFWIVQFFIQDQLGQSPLIAGLILAFALAILFTPLLIRAQKFIDQIVSGVEYDNSKTLREYSMTISNILNLDMLTTVVMGLISEAMENQRGTLFLVERDQETKKNGDEKSFYLRAAGGMVETLPQAYKLNEESPIAQFLGKHHQPLTQYDIDYHGEFQNTAQDDTKWFSGLGMDVYVPIYAKGNWMGLIALGPKASGVPYTENDLTLLSTLADQTAVALENAKLVEGLVRVNKELETAYADLSLTKQDLERLDRAKTDFISIASHELRTPITVIQGYSQMLQEDPSIGENSYFKNVVSGINNGITRLHKIVESMLDVAKIDSRELDISTLPISLTNVISRVIKGFKEDMLDRDIEINLGSLGDLPPIEADREALEKVFYQLVINAIKFTPDGGHIKIQGGTQVFENSQSMVDGVCISIKDSGIGIDPEHQQLIFRKFHQTSELELHSTGATKFKGSGPGLGLAIAQGIIDAHHGKIWVESPGYDEKSFPGSEFFVLLPVVQPKEKKDIDQEEK